MLKSDAKGLKNELVSISQALLAHGKDIDDLKADMQDVKIDMAAIKSLLMMKYKDIVPAFSQKRSPRQLNETGLRLFEDIDGKTFCVKPAIARSIFVGTSGNHNKIRYMQ